jgi:hypothetical protein
MSSDESTRVMGEVVPFVRGEAGIPHSDETRLLAKMIYCTSGARRPADVERLLQWELAGTGTPVPSQQTIGGWARDEGWAAEADELWRSHRQTALAMMQTLSMGNLGASLLVIRDILLREDGGDLGVVAAKLKAAELNGRFVERLAWLQTIEPPAREVDTSQMTRAEREAYNQARLVQRHRKGA